MEQYLNTIEGGCGGLAGSDSFGRMDLTLNPSTIILRRSRRESFNGNMNRKGQRIGFSR